LVESVGADNSRSLYSSSLFFFYESVKSSINSVSFLGLAVSNKLPFFLGLIVKDSTSYNAEPSDVRF